MERAKTTPRVSHMRRDFRQKEAQLTNLSLWASTSWHRVEHWRNLRFMYSLLISPNVAFHSMSVQGVAGDSGTCSVLDCRFVTRRHSGCGTGREDRGFDGTLGKRLKMSS